MSDHTIFEFTVIASCDIINLLGTDIASSFKRSKDNYEYYLSRGPQNVEDVRKIAIRLSKECDWFRQVYKAVARESGVETLGFISAETSLASKTRNDLVYEYTVIDSDSAKKAVTCINSLFDWCRSNAARASELIYQDTLEDDLLEALDYAFFTKDISFYVGTDDPALLFFCTLESTRNMLKQVAISRGYLRAVCVNVR